MPRSISEQQFLGLAAPVSQRRKLPRVKLLSGGGQLLVQVVRQRQVHVIAAQQNMVAHGHPRQLHLPGLLRDRHQGKIARAAAHIDHQDHVADLDILAKTLAHRLQPGVQGRLRFLEQRDMLKPGLLRGLDRSSSACRC